MDETIDSINSVMQKLDNVIDMEQELCRYSERLQNMIDDMTDQLNAALDALGVPERTGEAE